MSMVVMLMAQASPIKGAAREKRFSDNNDNENYANVRVMVKATAMLLVAMLMVERRRPSRVLRVRRDPLTRQDTSLPPSVHCRPHYVNR